ncbi:lanthionine synthetase C family protein [Candidatus Protofrankia californiensis]|uniref:lanthionine synthetase C family protein n=1 Tax=Candidatus Protofrankia californiensis TaxID=1839754 RepID=UPI001041AADC|nr:lanthionine synthetase C family protein [Candidatus Protofrankia californiensis]
MTRTDPLARPPGHDPSPDWSQSLSNGAAGIALLHIARAGIEGWDTAHQWVTAMTRSPVVADPDACGLFRGAPAVAFVLRAANHPAYAAALATLDGHITALTRQRLGRAYERIERGQLAELREFDLINGLTGIGVYLLQTHHTELLSEVLSYLVGLATESATVGGQRLPGWWTGHGPGDQPSPAWPGGHSNLGLAHGISGPLALLATAMRLGIIVPGHAEAIDRICAELDQWRCGTPGRRWWPGMISPAEWKAGAVQQPGPQRPGWCYGTPGLARAQQVAALALGDRRRQHEAESALAGCLVNEKQLAQLNDAGVCHGWAGLVQTTRRAAADAGPDSALAAVLPDLHTRFEQHFHRTTQATGDGLLEGAAGIALTRHICADTASATRWDACLLLAPPTL